MEKEKKQPMTRRTAGRGRSKWWQAFFAILNACRDSRWALAAVFVAWFGRDDLLPAIATWLTQLDPNQTLAVLFGWPVVVLAVVWLVGIDWLRDFVDSIESAGDIRRREQTRPVEVSRDSDVTEEGADADD